MDHNQTETTFRRELANAVRFLAIDAVEAAKSGHPGAPMGMADIAEVLWRDHLKHNPTNPAWPDRDRFVLSNGHGSMLLYALLHLSGYDLSIDDLKNFRQLGSKTAGHPEVGHTPGVETTTGPLGQGLTNAVGMALAEKLLAQRYNRPGCEIVDHRTWVFVGDGCLMEGISHEACSLAGVWGLDKLTCFYDDNGISIDGHVEGWFRDDTPGRFRAYGWHVVGPIDGHDPVAIAAAIAETKSARGKPSLIVCRTEIGHGSPNKAGTHDVHGAPLGAAEIAATRAALNWPHAPFEIPDGLRTAWDNRLAGASAEAHWQVTFAAYRKQFPELAAEFDRTQSHGLPEKWPEIKMELLAMAAAREAPVATRKSSQNCLDILVARVPELLGGSADLTGSNLTAGKTSRALHDAPTDSVPNYISYGVREFGMTAIMNGVALHGGLIPYGGTFAVFSDYARNAIRMSALMGQRVVHVLTHDSIGLGEDGPTHQPVEHASSLRIIPGLELWRPCDELETAIAWAEALERQDGPSALFLSRQNLPQYGGAASRTEGASRGGYVLSEADGQLQAVIIATGSEVALAMAAQAALAAQGIGVRVVSMPCTRRFDRQPSSWKKLVLPPDICRVAIEAGQTDFWHKYVGLDGEVLGIDEFGASAPAPVLYDHYGLTADNLARTVLRTIVSAGGSDGDF
ncbi:MAG: transketolase [Dechloromonas sp.]|uniref:transketolase n=1 Tax=Dechloromonas sp. CZR5 TaxID=2608630 RepID=UPI00123D23DB|nr:transketolase [Dechloromonas sp. CZR5]MBS4020182.1 transketolase [Dechloromonas sp.]